MAINPAQPDAISWTSPTPTSINLRWRPAARAVSYEIQSIVPDIRTVTSPTALLRGFRVSDNAIIQIRSVSSTGHRSGWVDVDVRTTVGPPQPPIPRGTVPLIDADRQSMRLRLPDPEGRLLDCLLKFWWQPSDAGWWASLEAPINARVITGRRLGTNCGLLDGMDGILDGNFVLRATAAGGVAEPTRRSFIDGTHALYWEAPA